MSEQQTVTSRKTTDLKRMPSDIVAAEQIPFAQASVKAVWAFFKQNPLTVSCYVALQ